MATDTSPPAKKADTSPEPTTAPKAKVTGKDRLARAHKNLHAMKTTMARPTTSPQGKQVLAQAIVKQEQLIEELTSILQGHGARLLPVQKDKPISPT